MRNVLSCTAIVALIAAVPLSASALDFTVTKFSRTDLGASQTDYENIRNATFATIFATEDFEGITDLGQIGSNENASLSTSVGDFTTLNGKPIDPEVPGGSTYATTQGSGTTAVDTNNSANGTDRGRNLSIRQDDDTPDNGGRQNTSFTTVDGQGGFTDKTYIDSNDTLGFRWIAKTDQNNVFDRLLFTLTDPADQGKRLTISAGGRTETHTIMPTQPNGEIFNVLIGFSTGVDIATISLAKSGKNDGFSADNFTVGAVPLPAAAWLLLGATGGLVAAKRRSARRAA